VPGVVRVVTVAVEVLVAKMVRAMLEAVAVALEERKEGCGVVGAEDSAVMLARVAGAQAQAAMLATGTVVVRMVGLAVAAAGAEAAVVVTWVEVTAAAMAVAVVAVVAEEDR